MNSPPQYNEYKLIKVKEKREINDLIFEHKKPYIAYYTDAK
jgi:hypothetical protein